MPSYTVDAVDRAVAVLMTVAAEPDLGVSEIARRAGDSKARAFRLLRTLEARGLVSRSEDGRAYRLGYSALLLGHAAAEQVDLVRLAQPVLEHLGRQVGETVQLRIREGRESVCVAKWEPVREVRVHSVVGRRRPLHAGSSKTLLAFLEPPQRDAILEGPLERLTTNTVIERARLRERLEEIRAAGYCVSRGEITEELVSVSAPVFGIGRQLAGVLNLAAPASRLPEARVEEVTPLVLRAARALSTSLGYAGTGR